MKISILASGSSGNSTYIETNNHNILIDVGLSGKKIENLLLKINKSITNIDTILITHEHIDHIQGLGVLARKYNINIYINKETFNKIKDKIRLSDKNIMIFDSNTTINLDEIKIKSFAVSHDAINPQFYTIIEDNKKVSIITDTGYVTKNIKKITQNSDVILMEANHDYEMLRMGKYNWNLKQRILSDQGHLSNDDSGYALCDLIGENTKYIYLCHLSKDNNNKDLAHLTIENILNEEMKDISNINILDTYANNPTKIIEI